MGRRRLGGVGSTCVPKGRAREASPGSKSGASARGLPRNLGDPMHSVSEGRQVGPTGAPKGLACGEQRVASAGANNDARHGTRGEGRQAEACGEGAWEVLAPSYDR